MNKKDYSLLRPFDLEAAKRGEAICINGSGEPATYIAGPDKSASIVCEVEGYFLGYFHTALRMAPLCWVEGRPVYRGDVLYGTGDCSDLTYIANKVDEDGLLHSQEGTSGCKEAPELLTWTPPKVKRTVKLLAWFDSDQLFWLREGAEPKWPSVRVPLEDRVIEIEEPAEVVK